MKEKRHSIKDMNYIIQGSKIHMALHENQFAIVLAPNAEWNIEAARSYLLSVRRAFIKYMEDTGQWRNNVSAERYSR